MLYESSDSDLGSYVRYEVSVDLVDDACLGGSQVTMTAIAAKKRNVNQFQPAAVANIAAMSTALMVTFKRSSIQS